MTEDMICVHRAASLGEADVVVAWLNQQGVPAHVKDGFSAQNVYVPMTVAPLGVEVCVADAQLASTAKALLQEHAEWLARRTEGRLDEALIDVTCNACGQTASFPIAAAGTPQVCPDCGRPVPVPQR